MFREKYVYSFLGSKVSWRRSVGMYTLYDTPSRKWTKFFLVNHLGPKPLGNPSELIFVFQGSFGANLLNKTPKMDDFQILNFQVHFLSSHWSQRAEIFFGRPSDDAQQNVGYQWGQFGLVWFDLAITSWYGDFYKIVHYAETEC